MIDEYLQKTIASPIYARGVGVHSGEVTTLKLLPAAPNTGIVFVRIDCTPQVHIPAQVAQVSDCSWSTTISKNGFKVSTIEHLLSAASGLGIDNLLIEIDKEEVPIMDGSSAAFVFLLQAAGIVSQKDAYKEVIRILQPITYTDGDKSAALLPSNRRNFELKIDFTHPLFTDDNQSAHFDFSKISYVKEVSRARTFCFLRDLEYLRANNLAKGGSLKNAIVLGQDNVLNEDGLRYPDECVRHKILDAVGDLYLAGCQILGDFQGVKSGHAVNYHLLSNLLNDRHAYERVPMHTLAQ